MVAVGTGLDVFIIGGGPVGLATAIAASQLGMRTVVADARTPPVDKACGEGMLPDGLPAALRLGVLPAGHVIRGIRFHCGSHNVQGDFPQGPGVGVRRLQLHGQLLRRALDAGVEVRWNTPVTSLAGIEARWIVGADGTSSGIRRAAGLDAATGTLTRFGFRKHFRLAPWTDYVEIHWGPGCQIYVTPVAPDEVGIALISRDPKLRVHQALALFPELRERLGAAQPASSERGAITGNRMLNNVTRDNVALVGDASGMVDAITGEGLGLGFNQALALARAMASDDLAGYQRCHRLLARRPRMMAKLLLALDRWPGVGKFAIRTMSSCPVIFSQLLAIHVGGGTRT